MGESSPVQATGVLNYRVVTKICSLSLNRAIQLDSPSVSKLLKFTNRNFSFVSVPNAKACLKFHEVLRPKFWQVVRLNYRNLYILCTLYYEMNHFPYEGLRLSLSCRRISNSQEEARHKTSARWSLLPSKISPNQS